MVGLAACGSTPAPAPPSAAPVAPPPASTAATGISVLARVTHRSIAVYRRAGALRPVEILSNPNHYGFPRVLLVKRAAPAWLLVYLPQRPNGSTGWVRRRDVRLVRDPYRLRIDLRRHRITLLRAGVVIDRGRIGVGNAVTPTPSGVYYLTELFRLTNPDGPYGPYGFGLSAYSDVLHEFAGADGQIGLHGTNDPSSIGSNVSHGCIRLSNAEITRLARLLPLGTPVHILRA
jgi:lipoprotein-anchoring transpeptidase ErfK/SrfK